MTSDASISAFRLLCSHMKRAFCFMKRSTAERLMKTRFVVIKKKAPILREVWKWEIVICCLVWHKHTCHSPHWPSFFQLCPSCPVENTQIQSTVQWWVDWEAKWMDSGDMINWNRRCKQQLWTRESEYWEEVWFVFHRPCYIVEWRMVSRVTTKTGTCLELNYNIIVVEINMCCWPYKTWVQCAVEMLITE